MSKFKVGDRVILTGTWDNDPSYSRGTRFQIVALTTSSYGDIAYPTEQHFGVFCVDLELDLLYESPVMKAIRGEI